MNNSESTKYFQTKLLGLCGNLHPVMDYVYTPKDAQNMRPHLKMLAGDYLSREKLSRQSQSSSHCLICDSKEAETYNHIISRCRSLDAPRQILMNKLEQFCREQNINFIDQIFNNEERTTQFILDPTSMNLPVRVNINDEVLPELMNICRNLVKGLHCLRMKQMKQLKQ